ncbi:Oidioi.mRNA.OKI2018_I69.PAR.g11766.t1.cds [Oikopleura dioica]|uniref:Oidioi.mRNA.OKI2018_I69.PAR.g11766.t1.cds n=1 Tax=Oikopleura dioica TaxID=34765 RepID=A0ABN7S063_OIKDI|nr:Oidioi.mRNA.OKI2018_I69.PAR.g11766.t1.cds [Oikopleura dioica]
MRTHGEFEWLFSSLAENPKYWGFIIPRTVVRHELFLKRIVEHPTLSADGDLQLFLTFPGQLEVPQQKRKLLNFFKAIYKTDDSSLLSIEDSDFFFETNKNFVLDYLPKLQG